MGVDVVSELSSFETANHLDELADLNTNLRVGLREEDIFKITSTRDFEHYRVWICQSYLLVYDSVVCLWLRH